MKFNSSVALQIALVFLLSTGPVSADENISIDVPALTMGSTHSSHLNDIGKPQRYKVQAASGDYVQGVIEGEKLELWLLNQSLHRIRRLAPGHGSQQEFRFVVGEVGPYFVELSGPANSAFVIRVQTIVPAVDQIAKPSPLESPTLRKLAQTLDTGGNTQSFWDTVQRQGTPLVEFDNVSPELQPNEALVTFVWRGAERNVRLFGAPSGDHDELLRLHDGDVWYRSYRLLRSTRMDYRLAPDVPELSASPLERRRAILATAQRDPNNSHHEPKTPVDDFEGFSIVELPDAPKPAWLHTSKSIPQGQLESHRFTSKILGNTRDIHVYRSQGYDPADSSHGLIVLFDGQQYIEDVQAPAILDFLVAEKTIAPVAAVLISNPSQASRGKELPCNDDFASFIETELMPWAREQKIHATRERTVVAGASFGGLASAFIALKLPELFGNAYCQSGSFWWAPGRTIGAKTSGEGQWLTRQYVQATARPVRFYLEAGTFESSKDIGGILETTRHLRDVLEAKAYDVRYHEFVGGHGYFYWRYTFANGITHLLGNQLANP